MAGDYQIPFSEQGDLLDYVSNLASGVKAKGVVWQDNFKFAGPVQITGMRRGRSAAHFSIEMSPFVSPDPLSMRRPARGTMFMVDFLAAAIKNGVLPGGRIPGTFTFVKRGQNYGVKLVD